MTPEQLIVKAIRDADERTALDIVATLFKESREESDKRYEMGKLHGYDTILGDVMGIWEDHEGEQQAFVESIRKYLDGWDEYDWNK